MRNSHEALTKGIKERKMAKNEQTGDTAGKSASKVLKDDWTGSDSKSAAGSALTQRADGKKKS